MPTNAPKVLVERQGPITTIVLNRPHVRNALDNDAARQLAAAFQAFDADDEARAGVLCGAGGSFCAGADLKEIAAGTPAAPWAGSVDGPLRAPLSKPVIAAVSGYACAGGLGLALWCDLRVIETDATFAVFSRRWGVSMSDGTTVRLPRLIGLSRSLDMLLTGRPVAAEEALAMGLANRLVPNGQARHAAETLAQEIAAFPQICMRSDRASAYYQMGLETDAAIAAEAQFAQQAREREAQSGAARFASGAGRHGAFGKDGDS